jgi:hypothetical protein
MNYSHAPAIIDELQTIPLDFADAFLSPGVSTLAPGLRQERRSAPLARAYKNFEF